MPEECTQRAKTGDTVKVHYTGRFEDQSIFNSSSKRDPLEFQLGAGRVIPGWDRGISGMCVGEKRLLTIPPELAYGNEERGPIPPGSTLIFETELVEISQVAPTTNQQDNVEVGSIPLPISKSSLGVWAIVGVFVAVVYYLVKHMPELEGGTRARVSKKDPQERMKQQRKKYR